MNEERTRITLTPKSFEPRLKPPKQAGFLLEPLFTPSMKIQTPHLAHLKIKFNTAQLEK